ncbi:hypothetical protein KM043_011225 [Ampulex compressa]|nr:hypothetical protein KM043_011225 [Ampulex compressa]
MGQTCPATIPLCAHILFTHIYGVSAYIGRTLGPSAKDVSRSRRRFVPAGAAFESIKRYTDDTSGPAREEIRGAYYASVSRPVEPASAYLYRGFQRAMALRQLEDDRKPALGGFCGGTPGKMAIRSGLFLPRRRGTCNLTKLRGRIDSWHWPPINLTAAYAYRVILASRGSAEKIVCPRTAILRRCADRNEPPDGLPPCARESRGSLYPKQQLPLSCSLVHPTRATVSSCGSADIAANNYDKLRPACRREIPSVRTHGGPPRLTGLRSGEACDLSARFFAGHAAPSLILKYGRRPRLLLAFPRTVGATFEAPANARCAD